MQAKVIKMLKNALQPSLLDCKVTWDLPTGCSAESVPKMLPPVFSGDSLIVYGVLSLTKGKDAKPLIGTVTLTATLSTEASGDKRVTHKVSFEGVSSESGENKLLHRLAAKALIQAKQQHQHDMNRNYKKEEIIRLSKSANVISKLTSFVAVDKDSHEPVSHAMTKPPPNMLHLTALKMLRGGCVGYGAADIRGSRCAKSQYGDATGKGLRCKMIKTSFECKKKSKDMPTPVPLSLNSTPPRDVSPLPAAGCPLPGVRSSQPSKGNNLLDLVSLQKASGSWQLTEQLARICGVTLDKLKQTCPSQLTVSNKESLWATALALSCLFGKFKDKTDEWEMVAGKGVKWLKKSIDNEVVSYENIMEMADNALAN